MSQPPYPPSAQGPGPYPQDPYSGGGPGAAPPMQRPKEVDNAFYLWLASIVVGLLGALVSVFQSGDLRQQAVDQAVAADPTIDPAVVESAAQIGLVVGLVVGLAILALQLLFVFKMRAGRNWARIVLTVLGVLSVLFSLLGLGQLTALPLVLSILSMLLIVGAIVMMFVKGANPWFRRPARA